MKRKTLSGILLWLALGLLLPTGAPAAVVGHITQMEGRVDLLKQGQVPATPVQLQDGVETGDVIRTKSLSKAQITFIDKSTLTIAPETRIAIETYMVDESKGKRNVVLKMFQGLALAVVSKIYQSEEPNFVVKTQTAIMGIRGTEVGIRLFPNFSEFLNFEGRTRVQSIFPEIQGVVELNDGQGSRVTWGLSPTMPFEVTREDRQHFINQLTRGVIARTQGRDSGPESSGYQGGDQGRGSIGTGNMSIITIPPLIKPATQETIVTHTVKKEEPPPPPPPPPPPCPRHHRHHKHHHCAFKPPPPPCPPGPPHFGHYPHRGTGHHNGPGTGPPPLGNHMMATSPPSGHIISAVHTLPPGPITTQVIGAPGPRNRVRPQGSPAIPVCGSPGLSSGSGPHGLSGGGHHKDKDK